MYTLGASSDPMLLHCGLQDMPRDRRSSAISIFRCSGVVSGSVSRAAMFHERASVITIECHGSAGPCRRYVHVGVEAVGNLAGDDPGIAVLAGKVRQHGGGLGPERHGP